MIRCGQCGAEIPDGSKFCDQCGKTVAAAPPPPATPSPQASPSATKRCPQCGAEMPVGGRFCPGCGHDAAAASAPPGAAKCTQCGAELVPGAAFCAACGQAAGSKVTPPPAPTAPPPTPSATPPPGPPPMPAAVPPPRASAVPPPMPAAAPPLPSAATSICGRCGQPLKPGIRFCGSCGAPAGGGPVPAAYAPSAAPPRKSSGCGCCGGLLAVLLVVLAVAGFFGLKFARSLTPDAFLGDWKIVRGTGEDLDLTDDTDTRFSIQATEGGYQLCPKDSEPAPLVLKPAAPRQLVATDANPDDPSQTAEFVMTLQGLGDELHLVIKLGTEVKADVYAARQAKPKEAAPTP